MTHPNHLNIYLDNIIEVENLLSIHEKVSGIGRGRKVDVEILNKSIIVLLVACWESFIEVIIEDAFTIMLNSARTHTIFPSSVLTKASKEIRSSKDDREIWKIAGDGWRQVLTDYKDNLLRNQIDYFHSPKANNIGELCENILGLKNITSHWSWKGQVLGQSPKTLNKLIELRGKIAHKLKAGTPVYKATAIKYINFIGYLLVVTHNAINEYLGQKIGKPPWPQYSYSKNK